MSRTFIIHGWGGSPESDWLPWAKEELKSRGYQVFVPAMPDTEHPAIKPWVDMLAETVGAPQESDIMIGHSVGCQAILRYLESFPQNTHIDKAILIAPWVTLKDLESEEGWQIIDEWLKSPMDFARIKSKAQEFVTVFSDNDPWVTYPANKEYFKKHLQPNQLIVKHNHAHFHQDAGYTTLPLLLELIS